MAKVVAPLGSFSASGKIGKSLVFMTHLGRNVVRGLVTPANPQTTGQGDSRLLLGALGRAARALVDPSDYVTDAKAVTPSGQTYVSQMIKKVIDEFGSGNTGVSAIQAAVDGHSADADFESQAASLGLTDLTVAYATSGDTTLSAGAQLYALAAYAFNVKGSDPSLFNRSPYTTALASWTSTEIAAFAADIQSEA